MVCQQICPGDWLYSRLGDLAEKVTANLSGTSATTNTTTKKENLYRVQVGAYSVKNNADFQFKKVKAAGFDTYMVKVGGLYKIQVGAYSKKENADNMLKKLKAKGFDAFITTQNGTAVATVTKKSIDEIAKEVIRGDWGNGTEREKKLKTAGYDYAAVQKRVNELL